VLRIENETSSKQCLLMRCLRSQGLHLLRKAECALVPLHCQRQISQSGQHFGLTDFIAWRMLAGTPYSLRGTAHSKAEMRRFKFKTRCSKFQMPHLKLETCHPKLQMRRSKFKTRHSKLQMPHPKFKTCHSKFKMRRSKFETPHLKFGTRHSKLQTRRLKFQMPHPN